MRVFYSYVIARICQLIFVLFAVCFDFDSAKPFLKFSWVQRQFLIFREIQGLGLLLKKFTIESLSFLFRNFLI